MRLFKASYKDKNNKTRYSKKWYLDFRDHLELRHKIPVYTDKRQSEAFGRRVEELVITRGAGEPPKGQLQAWLECQPDKLLKQFASWGLIEGHRVAANKTLAQHAADWKTSLAIDSKENAKQKYQRVMRVFDECGFQSFSDIAASKVKLVISQLKRTVRKKIDGVVQPVEIGEMAAQTRNYYLEACRQFCKWAVLDRRISSNPIEHLEPKKITKGLKAKNRRALEPEEIASLLQTTALAGMRYGMNGHDRALLYQFACETGLRANEIRSLKAKDLDFKEATITVAPVDTKNKQGAILPLRRGLCEILEPLISKKLPEARLFNLPSKWNMADMLRADLEAVGIDPADNGQGELDFHALRHSFGTLLAAAGVHPKTAQDLMRHSDINLTMTRYTHTLRGQGAKAVESLPDFKGMAMASQVLTGTDAQPVNGAGQKDVKAMEISDSSLASSLATGCAQGRTSANFNGLIESICTTLKASLPSQKQHFLAENPASNPIVMHKTDSHTKSIDKTSGKSLYSNTLNVSGSVAQLVEQRPFKP